MDAAEPRDRGVGERLHLRGIAHVGDDALDLDARRRELRDGGVERGDFDVTDDDAASLPRRSAGASARPIPLAPPVTTATLPAKSCMALFYQRHAGSRTGTTQYR